MTNDLKRVLILAALAHLSLELVNNFLPVVYPVLTETLDLSYAQIGTIALVAVTGTSLVQPLFGFLTDRWGPLGLATLSISWTGLMMGLIGLVNSYWLLLVLVGLAALGSAAFHPPGAIIASVSGGGRRKGAAVSIFSVGGNLGAALSPLLVGGLLYWWGLRGILVLIPISLFCGVWLLTQLRRTYHAGLLPASHQSVSNKTTHQKQISSIIILSLIILLVMVRSWFQMSLVTYLPLWLESGGWSIGVAGTLLFLLSGLISVGSLSGGTLSDKFGRWQVAGLSMILLVVGYSLFLNATGWFQVLLIGLLGIFIGASYPVTIVMAYEAWPQRVGLAASLVMGVGWFPGGVGSWVTGKLADLYSLELGMQSLVVAPALGILCVIAMVKFQRQPEPDSV